MTNTSIRSLGSTFIAALTLAMCGLTVGAQSTKFPFGLPEDSRTAPMITRSPSGSVVVSFAQRRHGRHVLSVARSTDEGESWIMVDSATVLYSALFGLQRRPTVIETPNGTLVGSFEDVRPGDQSPRVYSIRSTDAGQTWSQPQPVAAPSQSAMQDFTSMACAPDGTLFVAYISHDATALGTHLLIQRSTDSGLTWQPPVRVTGSPWIGRACECCMTSITVGTSGLVAVAFRANISDVRDIHVAFSSNNGETFQTPIRVQNAPWTVEGCPATGPDVTIDDGNRAHVTWRDFRDGAVRPVVYYARVEPSTASLVENLDLSSDVSDFVDYPSLCTDRLGSRATIAFESGKGLIVRHVIDNAALAASIIDERATRDVGTRLTATPLGRPALVWRTLANEMYDIGFSLVDITSSVENTLAADINSSNIISFDVDILGRHITNDYRGMVFRATFNQRTGRRTHQQYIR